MYPYLRLGPFLLQLPLLVLLVGVWIGISLTEKEAARLKLPVSTVSNLVFIGLIAGILGARLAYAARHLNAYLENPLGLFSLNVNTLAGLEGLMIGIVVAGFYGWRKKLPLRSVLDALAPGLAAFLVALGVSHLLSGNAYGSPADLPWAINLWNEYRHPTQVYETVIAAGIFYLAYQKPFGTLGDGNNFLTVVALSCMARIFLEAFRGDSLIWPGSFRAAQVISIIILAISLYGRSIWARTNSNGTEKG